MPSSSDRHSVMPSSPAISFTTCMTGGRLGRVRDRGIRVEEKREVEEEDWIGLEGRGE
jgi:hypothetical protein